VSRIEETKLEVKEEKPKPQEPQPVTVSPSKKGKPDTKKLIKSVEKVKPEEVEVKNEKT